MEKKYKFSEIIEINTKPDDPILENILTKERFKITKKSLDIIHFIKNSTGGINKSEIEKEYHQINKTELNDFFNFLVTKRIIIKEDKDPKILTMKPLFGLFGSSIKNSLVVEDSIVYLGIPFGKGNTIATETSLYPNKIRVFSHKYGIINNDILPFSEKPVYDVGDIYFYENEYTYISYFKITEIIRELVNNNNKVFSLGGDHSVTHSIIAGLNETYKNINIIHLDAHTDYYRSLIHDLHEKSNFCSYHHGNFLKRTIELNNVINIFQYGIRGINRELKSSKKVKTFRINQIKQFLNDLKIIDKNSPTYITFDIDIIDPVYAPGTATPVINGLQIGETLNLINEIKKMKLNIIGVDLVEVNPEKDIGNITMQVSVEIIKHLTNLL